MSLSRADRQTQALVLLLKALPEAQLIDVLRGVDASLDNAEPESKAPLRKCRICGLGYPMHMARWGKDDHPFEVGR